MAPTLLSRELAALGLDLADTLREDPRFLTDGAFLGALHLELRERLGDGDARAALLQLGFLHGLRDALELVARGFGGGEGRAGRPRVALTLDGVPGAEHGAVRGVLRDAVEARALIAAGAARGAAACALSCGYASGWLSGLFDTDLLAREHDCAAAGAARCAFEARTPEVWGTSGDAAASDDLARLPFSPLRDLVARHLASQAATADAGGESFERGAPVIHVWGPVMVIPFSGADETIAGLDLIRRDSGARDVRVVVVDLAGAIIDESFGALALERVLEAIERAGAEPILTGISPLSERTVAELEVSHLIVRKDLPEAIATAFQIADSMRRAL